MAYIYVKSTTSKSISVNLSGCDTSFEKTDRVCSWYLDGSYKGKVGLDAYVASGGDFTFTGLKSNTTYDISVIITSAHFSDVTLYKTAQTDAAPSIKSFSASQVSGTLNAYCEWSIKNSSSLLTYEIRAATSYPSDFETSGYRKGFYSYDERDGTISFDKIVTAYVWLNLFEDDIYIDSDIISIVIKPDTWSWSASNGDATSTQTKNAYNAVTNNGSTSSFSYYVWNDMVNKVYDILSAINATWNSRYATYVNTLMSSYDKELTADRFNSLRFNIGAYYSTGINEVNSGDVVYGSYFVTLASCINQWLANL